MDSLAKKGGEKECVIVSLGLVHLTKGKEEKSNIMEKREVFR